MQRGGQTEKIARAILWLLSEEAWYTADSFIEVTGGRWTTRRGHPLLGCRHSTRIRRLPCPSLCSIGASR
ncbi:hypothetical protein GCM10023342_00100 [Modicisalibacter zincidurans]|uniref:SDR family oxidoreductase n=2 Tax=Oceanospirillales TaxID=135619 RepID=A0ABP9QXX8_9GAMM